jgi:hypothetical protein
MRMVGVKDWRDGVRRASRAAKPPIPGKPDPNNPDPIHKETDTP